MPKIHRKTDVTTGHGCYPPTIPASFSPDTFGTDILNIVRYGDTIVSHCCGTCHAGTYVGQKCEVYVNGRYAQLKGDPVDCGDFIDTHDPTWDCCSEVMEALLPKIEVNPPTIDFGPRIVGGIPSGPAEIGGVIGQLELPFIPIVVINAGGPTLILQYASYGPINPSDSHVGCNTTTGSSVSEYPDFLFKNLCWPIGLASGEFTTFEVNFVPTSTGVKTMNVDIYSQPNQPIKTVTLKGTGIDIPPAP